MTATAGRQRGPGLRRTGTRAGRRDAVRSGDRPGSGVPGIEARGRAGAARRLAGAGTRPLTGAEPSPPVPSTFVQSPCTVICQLRRNSHVREP